MLHFSDTVIINTTVLCNALKSLSANGFKVFMYTYNSAIHFSDYGQGYSMGYLTKLEEDLQLNYDQLVDGFIENKQKNYLDALVVIKNHDQEIEFQWILDLVYPNTEAEPDTIDHAWIEDLTRVNFHDIQEFLVIDDLILSQCGEVKSNKIQYINTKHWRIIRQEALERDKFQCTECDSTDHLHVHHLTYENEGHEKLEDLIILCRGCHAKKPKRKTSEVKYEHNEANTREMSCM